MNTRQIIPFIVLAAVLAAGCHRESPAASETYREEIPVTVEQLRGGTKVSVDGLSGACLWEDYDHIAVYVAGTGANAYVDATVRGGAIQVELSEGQTRAKWAVYPFASGTSVDYDSPMVLYPASYNMSGISTATRSYAPMVAANNNPNALDFYHVGGLMQLNMRHVPSGTTSLAVRFTFSDDKYVTGKFTVNSPGTPGSTTTYARDGGNIVSFTGLTVPSSGEITLNIPLPTQNYSTLSAIRLTPAGGSSTTPVVKSVSGWSDVGHAQGKKLLVDFESH